MTTTWVALIIQTTQTRKVFYYAEKRAEERTEDRTEDRVEDRAEEEGPSSPIHDFRAASPNIQFIPDT